MNSISRFCSSVSSVMTFLPERLTSLPARVREVAPKALQCLHYGAKACIWSDKVSLSPIESSALTTLKLVVNATEMVIASHSPQIGLKEGLSYLANLTPIVWPCLLNQVSEQLTEDSLAYTVFDNTPMVLGCASTAFTCYSILESQMREVAEITFLSVYEI